MLSPMAEIYDQYLPAIGTPLALRDSEKTFLRASVVPAPSPTANLAFQICRVDANTTLISSENPPGTGETSAVIGPMCARCQAAQTNNPTLFAHALRLITAQRWISTTVQIG